MHFTYTSYTQLHNIVRANYSTVSLRCFRVANLVYIQENNNYIHCPLRKVLINNSAFVANSEISSQHIIILFCSIILI